MECTSDPSFRFWIENPAVFSRVVIPKNVPIPNCSAHEYDQVPILYLGYLILRENVVGVRAMGFGVWKEDETPLGHRPCVSKIWISTFWQPKHLIDLFLPERVESYQNSCVLGVDISRFGMLNFGVNLHNSYPGSLIDFQGIDLGAPLKERYRGIGASKECYGTLYQQIPLVASLFSIFTGFYLWR